MPAAMVPNMPLGRPLEKTKLVHSQKQLGTVWALGLDEGSSTSHAIYRYASWHSGR